MFLLLGELIFLFGLFYYFIKFFELKYRLLLELLKLFTFLIDDFSKSIFYLNVSAKVDFFRKPVVVLGIVDFVRHKV